MATENIIYKPLIDTEANLRTRLIDGEFGIATDTSAVVYKNNSGVVQTISSASSVTANIRLFTSLPDVASENVGDVIILTQVDGDNDPSVYVLEDPNNDGNRVWTPSTPIVTRNIDGRMSAGDKNKLDLLANIRTVTNANGLNLSASGDLSVDETNLSTVQEYVSVSARNEDTTQDWHKGDLALVGDIQIARTINTVRPTSTPVDSIILFDVSGLPTTGAIDISSITSALPGTIIYSGINGLQLTGITVSGSTVDLSSFGGTATFITPALDRGTFIYDNSTDKTGVTINSDWVRLPITNRNFVETVNGKAGPTVSLATTDLTDVRPSPATHNQILRWHSGNDQWQPDAQNLTDNNDIVFTNIQPGQILSYDSVSGSYIWRDLNINDLSDVSVLLTDANQGKYLQASSGSTVGLSANTVEETSKLAVLGDKDITTPTAPTSADANKVLRLNSSADGLEYATPTGRESFVALSDTPNSLSGDANKVPVVNGLEDELEFRNYSILGLTDTPVSYVGKGSQRLEVKADESGIDFVANPVHDTPIYENYGNSTNAQLINRSQAIFSGGTFTGLSFNSPAPVFTFLLYDTSGSITIQSDRSLSTSEIQLLSTANTIEWFDGPIATGTLITQSILNLQVQGATNRIDITITPLTDRNIRPIDGTTTIAIGFIGQRIFASQNLTPTFTGSRITGVAGGLTTAQLDSLFSTDTRTARIADQLNNGLFDGGGFSVITYTEDTLSNRVSGEIIYNSNFGFKNAVQAVLAEQSSKDVLVEENDILLLGPSESILGEQGVRVFEGNETTNAIFGTSKVKTLLFSLVKPTNNSFESIFGTGTRNIHFVADVTTQADIEALTQEVASASARSRENTDNINIITPKIDEVYNSYLSTAYQLLGLENTLRIALKNNGTTSFIDYTPDFFKFADVNIVNNTTSTERFLVNKDGKIELSNASIPNIYKPNSARTGSILVLNQATVRDEFCLPIRNEADIPSPTIAEEQVVNQGDTFTSTGLANNIVFTRNNIYVWRPIQAGLIGTVSNFGNREANVQLEITDLGSSTGFEADTFTFTGARKWTDITLPFQQDLTFVSPDFLNAEGGFQDSLNDTRQYRNFFIRNNSTFESTARDISESITENLAATFNSGGANTGAIWNWNATRSGANIFISAPFGFTGTFTGALNGTAGLGWNLTNHAFLLRVVTISATGLGLVNGDEISTNAAGTENITTISNVRDDGTNTSFQVATQTGYTTFGNDIYVLNRDIWSKVS